MEVTQLKDGADKQGKTWVKMALCVLVFSFLSESCASLCLPPAGFQLLITTPGSRL